MPEIGGSINVGAGYSTTIVLEAKDVTGPAFDSVQGNITDLAKSLGFLKDAIGKNLAGELIGRLSKLSRIGTFSIWGAAAVGIASVADVAIRGDKATIGFAGAINSLGGAMRELIDGPTPKFAETFKEYMAEAGKARKAINTLTDDAGSQLDDALNPRPQNPRSGLTQAQSTAFDDFFARSGKASGDAANRIHALRDAGPQSFADRIRADSPGVDKGWAAQQGQAEYDRAMASAKSQFSRIAKDSQARVDQMVSMQNAGMLRNGGGGVGSMLGGVGKNLVGDALGAGRGVMTRIQEGMAPVKEAVADVKEHFAKLQSVADITADMQTPQERFNKRMAELKGLLADGVLPASVFKRARTDAENQFGINQPVNEIAEALKQPGTTPGLRASESRFLTMGRGQMDPAAKAAVEGNRQRQRQIEQQKQAHDTLKRIEQKWADAAKIEIVNTA